jgi:hypothetical protein
MLLVINVIIKRLIFGLPKQELGMRQKLSFIDVLSVNILGESIGDYLNKGKPIF